MSTYDYPTRISRLRKFRDLLSESDVLVVNGERISEDESVELRESLMERIREELAFASSRCV